MKKLLFILVSIFALNAVSALADPPGYDQKKPWSTMIGYA